MVSITILTLAIASLKGRVRAEPHSSLPAAAVLLHIGGNDPSPISRENRRSQKSASGLGRVITRVAAPPTRGPGAWRIRPRRPQSAPFLRVASDAPYGFAFVSFEHSIFVSS